MNLRNWEKWKERILPFIKKENLILMVLAGILLLIISIPSGNGRSGKKETGGDTSLPVTGKQELEQETNTQEMNDETPSEESYRKALQEELAALLMQMDGAGKVQVMIVLKESGETILEKNSKMGEKKTDESTATDSGRTASEMTLEENVFTDGEKEPYVTKRIYPRIEGVVVLATGVGNGRVKSEISEAVATLLGLEQHKIKVLKLSNRKVQ